jgi:hypothetical protein
MPAHLGYHEIVMLSQLRLIFRSGVEEPNRAVHG